MEPNISSSQCFRNAITSHELVSSSIPGKIGILKIFFPVTKREIGAEPQSIVSV